MSDTRSQPTVNRPQEATRPARRVGFPVDVYETRDELQLLADLPGVPPENLEVRVDRRELTIQGARDDRPVRYHRVFTLPDNVDPARIQAEVRHGVLHLSMPRTGEPQPRRIPVRSAP